MKPSFPLTAPLALALTLVAACGGAPPRTPNATRPLDERRAVPLIAKAFSDEEAKPSEPREIKLPTGKKLRVDVSSAGHKWGVAYVTAADLATLDPNADLPPRPQNGDLAVVQGSGPDADAVVLVLFADDYKYDDLVGEEHESTTITAENKLKRDVRDFIVQAKARKLP